MSDLAVRGVHDSFVMRLVERVVLEVAGPVAQYAPKLFRWVARDGLKIHFESEGLNVRWFIVHSLHLNIE